jgi:hypothetical protein
MLTWVVDNYRLLGLEIPGENVDELQALGVWSAVREFRVIDDMISWHPVLWAHDAAVTTRIVGRIRRPPQASCSAS